MITTIEAVCNVGINSLEIPRICYVSSHSSPTGVSSEGNAGHGGWRPNHFLGVPKAAQEAQEGC